MEMFESLLDNDLIVISFQEVEMKVPNFFFTDSHVIDGPLLSSKKYSQWDIFFGNIFTPEIFHRDSFACGSTMMLFFYKKDPNYIESIEFKDVFLGTLNQIGNKAAIGLHVILL